MKKLLSTNPMMPSLLGDSFSFHSNNYGTCLSTLGQSRSWHCVDTHEKTLSPAHGGYDLEVPEQNPAPQKRSQPDSTTTSVTSVVSASILKVPKYSDMRAPSLPTLIANAPRQAGQGAAAFYSKMTLEHWFTLLNDALLATIDQERRNGNQTSKFAAEHFTSRLVATIQRKSPQLFQPAVSKTQQHLESLLRVFLQAEAGEKQRSCWHTLKKNIDQLSSSMFGINQDNVTSGQTPLSMTALTEVAQKLGSQSADYQEYFHQHSALFARTPAELGSRHVTFDTNIKPPFVNPELPRLPLSEREIADYSERTSFTQYLSL